LKIFASIHKANLEK